MRVKLVKWSKRGLIVFPVLLLFFAVSLFHGQQIIIRRYKVIDKPLNGDFFLSASSECSDLISAVKVIALADLHGETLGEEQEMIVSRVASENPKLIFYLGDMVDRDKPEESAEALVILTERLAQIAPIYYADGNHELFIKDHFPDIYEYYNEKIAKFGAVRLDNEIVSVRLSEHSDMDNASSTDRTVNLCGITTHYYWDEKEYVLTSALKKMDGVNILLCHYPESVIWYDAFNGEGLDVALCGHTHGGLVRVPLLGGYYAPEQSRWPKYDMGAFPIYTDTTWSDYGGRDGARYLGTMIISSGLAGEHGIPRVNNPREISVVDIMMSK